jgi:POT family proton-dependent oligopeptide transporter
LALFESNRTGFYVGAVFDRVRAPAASNRWCRRFVGDQFDADTTSTCAKVVFDAFYWSINFGSFFASLLMPLLPARITVAAVAFGIPGVLMLHRDDHLLGRSRHGT